MAWLLLEALVALLLAGFIVWYTTGGQRGGTRANDRADKGAETRNAKDGEN